MRKISFIFFLFFSVMSFTFSSFAGVASGSNAMRVPRASWSNASHAWEDFKDSFDQLNDVDLISDRASGLPTFDNTVNYSGVRVGVYYEDVLKKRHWAWSDVGSDGWYNIVKPDDYARIVNVVIRLSRSAIPQAGKYTMKVRNSVQGGGSNYITKYFFYVEKSVSNATAFYQNINLSGQSNYSEYYIEDSVNLPTSYSYMNVTADYDGDHSFGFPFNGAVKIQFVSLDNSASTSVNPTAGSGVNDTANNTAEIANNSNRQVEQGDSIIELIKNTIQTISSQLESFWNQLAGEFTNLYNKMNQHHSEDLAITIVHADSGTGESHLADDMQFDSLLLFWAGSIKVTWIPKYTKFFDSFAAPELSPGQYALCPALQLPYHNRKEHVIYVLSCLRSSLIRFFKSLFSWGKNSLLYRKKS